MQEQRSTAITGRDITGRTVATHHAPFDGVDPDIYLPSARSGRNGHGTGHPNWMRRVPILSWFLA